MLKVKAKVALLAKYASYRSEFVVFLVSDFCAADSVLCGSVPQYSVGDCKNMQHFETVEYAAL